MNATRIKTAPVLWRLIEAIGNIRFSFSLTRFVPEGYEDESGFHYGVKPTARQISWPPTE